MEKADVGIIGLGVMGKNLTLNLARKGFKVAAFDRIVSRRDAFFETKACVGIHACKELSTFTGMLKTPRQVMLMVPAGETVDAVIQDLMPHLESGDLIMDLGNSYFLDTERRAREVQSRGLRFLGVGMSGGPVGALTGPSFMLGGDPLAFNQVEALFETLAARAGKGEPCVDFVGPRGAGHYVKMVHNGIEYGDMQLIAEAYDLLRRPGKLSPREISAIFAQWNQGPLNSFLLEITGRILGANDPESGEALVDVIRDRAGDKGTGRWVCKNALELGVPIPTLFAAMDARLLSSRDQVREGARDRMKSPDPDFQGDRESLIEDVKTSLQASRICACVQGLALLHAASEAYDYLFDLSSITRTWQGGCIIRSRLIEEMHEAFKVNPGWDNLILVPCFSEPLAAAQPAWRRTIQAAAASGVSCPAMAASLAYYDALRSDRLSASLIQAQRNYFGGHTMERRDRPGSFQVDWENLV